MKKEWNKPTINSAGVKKTKDNVVCPYKQDNINQLQSTADQFGPERCCPCEFYNACHKDWKYNGPCPS